MRVLQAIGQGTEKSQLILAEGGGEHKMLLLQERREEKGPGLHLLWLSFPAADSAWVPLTCRWPRATLGKHLRGPPGRKDETPPTWGGHLACCPHAIQVGASKASCSSHPLLDQTLVRLLDFP